MKQREHILQNEIRNALVDLGLIFRANVGRAWVGEECRLADGSLLLRNPRPFSTGLSAGFSDLFGFAPVLVTPEMVGQTIAVFVAIECKSARGRPTDAQVRFIRAVQGAGGRAGFARSAQEALAIVTGGDDACD